MPEKSNSYSLYLHIPFCEKKCAYCDFNSVAGQSSLVPHYTKALQLQFDSFRSFRKGKKLDTLYIGGGTPSLLSPEQWINLSQLWKNETGIREITVEVNPASLSLEKMDAYKRSGVSRISMGVQSFCDPVLKDMGRVADSRTLQKALGLFRNHWSDSWSIDLIYGYPGASLEDSLSDIDKAYTIHIPHLSLYQLTLEEDTPLSNKLSKSEIEDLLARQDLYWPALKERLNQRGYRRYEISSFSRKEPCFHNLHYWNMDPWLGLGVSASGMIPLGDNQVLHFQGSSNLQEYLNQAERGFSLQSCIQEKVQGSSYHMELMMMGFRSTQGVSIEKLERSGFPWASFLDYINSRFGESYILEKQNRLLPSDQAMDYHNALMMAVMDFLPQDEY